MAQYKSFNIRVYGLIMNDLNEILISDEFQLGMKMTKSPGGGLKYGEGIVDCLKREFREECNDQQIINLQHFYTTDFFQKALFYDHQQLISIYFTAKLAIPIKISFSNKPFDFSEMKNGNQSFRWVNIHNLKANMLSFPIDKYVINLLKKHIK